MVGSVADNIITMLAERVVQESAGGLLKPDPVADAAGDRVCDSSALAGAKLVEQVRVEVENQQSAMVATLNLLPRKTEVFKESALDDLCRRLDGLRNQEEWHTVTNRRSRKKCVSPPPSFDV